MKNTTLRILLIFLIALSYTMVLPASASSVTSADMISYYRMDNFTDSMGGPAAGCSTCPSAVKGYMGGAKDFNGVAASLNVADVNQFDWSVNTSFTFEFWMKKDSACSGSNEVIVGRNDSATQLHWWIGIKCTNASPPGTVMFNLKDRNGVGDPIVSGKVLTDGKWHHVVGVRDAGSSQNRLYVDGKLESSSSQSYSAGFDSAAAPLNVGWLNLDGGYYYGGRIDELAVYNRALTEREIRSHYYLYRGYLEACNQQIRIMPLGDSITYGTYLNDPIPVGMRIGYRGHLWWVLMAAGYNAQTIDFIGNMRAGQAKVPSIDPDHAGFPGITEYNVWDLLHRGWLDYPWEPPRQETPGPYLETYPADVILLHIGTNGNNFDENNPDTSAVDVANILNKVDEYELNSGKSVTVILAKIINRMNYSADTHTFNNNINSMALTRIANGDKIIIVKMENGAGIDYSTDMINPLHPNDAGYAKMAGVWMDALETFMPVCEAPTVPEPPRNLRSIEQ